MAMLLAWLLDHVLAIAVAATLVHSVLTARTARQAHAHAAGLELAVDYLAERAGISREEIDEDHYRQHPECRPVETDGGR